MARKSERLSSGAKSTPVHKRAASGNAQGTKLKRSKTNITATKSEYFEEGDGADELAEDDDVITSIDGDDVSEFDHDDDSAVSESPTEDEGSDDGPSQRRARPRNTTKSSKTSTATDSDLWRPGVKAGLGPGTQVVIKKPKARPAGNTPYADHRIHPNTLLFLKDLKMNNDRQWLKMHDAEFRQAEKDWYSFVEKLTERLIEIDDTIPELPVKDVIFRIYRDIRFSPDPTPYKPHFSAAWSRTGRKGPYAAYYVQINPEDSLVGGGLYQPDAAPTAAIRHDIDRHPRRIKDVLLDDGVRKDFLGRVAKNDAKVVKAFVSNNSETALKTRPKGYDKDHADIELLRLRSYTIGSKVPQADVTAADSLDRIASLLAAMKPFITYLNSVVMPDEAGSDEEENSDSGADSASDEGGADSHDD